MATSAPVVKGPWQRWRGKPDLHSYTCSRFSAFAAGRGTGPSLAPREEAHAGSGSVTGCCRSGA